jgi:hypothetical protein
VSQFGNGDFANNLARNQPLPEAFTNNSYNSDAAAASDRANDRASDADANNGLSANRLGQLFKLLGDIFKSNDASEIKNKMTDLFKLLSENANNRDTIQNARTNVQFFSGGATISA